jgi:hypothetical protein
MPYALFHWGSGENCGTTFRASRGATCCPAGHCSLPLDAPGLCPRLRNVLQHGVGNGQGRAKGHKQRCRSPGGSAPRSHDLWHRPGFSLRQEARSGTKSRRRSFPIVDFEIAFGIPSGIFASGFLCLNSCQKKDEQKQPEIHRLRQGHSNLLYRADSSCDDCDQACP